MSDASHIGRFDAIAIHHQSALTRYRTESLPTVAAITAAITHSLRAGGKLLIFGNGGSAADAQHVAGEFVGRFLQESPPYAAIALTTDTSILTCVGNDWSFEEVFARQVTALARPGDVVCGISTSGNSPNILAGIAAGKAAGATTIGFTGEPGGALPAACDHAFQAPATATPRIQELHLLAWHSICQVIEEDLLADG